MTNLPTLRRAKQRATALKKQNNITQAEALLVIAKEYGFSDWASFKNKIEYKPNLTETGADKSKHNMDPSESSQNLAHEYNAQNDSEIANELLEKLKELAKEAFSTERTGDTGIGYTLEKKLGIEANSSSLPDYKGIELKSGRKGKNRNTLFAQVCDWSISPCKKSSEILQKYGYNRGNDRRLYCTITTKKENTQGLSFIYNKENDQLEEWFNKKELVAVWPGKLLRKRLKEKHSETFWIEANIEIIDGIEYFKLTKVTHTKSPMLDKLIPLIEDGIITMDHLIKKNGSTGKVCEKGPLFKIKKENLNLLFPEPITYSLR